MLARAALLCACVVSLPAAAAGEVLAVRVLESHHLSGARVEVHGGMFSCDGVATPDWLAKLHVHGTRVEFPGGRLCQEVSASDVSVAVSAREERRYRGGLKITADHGVLRLINVVPLEDYLASVVASEMSGDYDALKAQAVVSRTYALANRQRHQREGYDLCDLTHCQLYGGRRAESKDASAAVAATTGQVLQVHGQRVPAFFHANCGGHTSSARDIFGELGAGLPVAEAVVEGGPACARSPDFRWSWEVPRAQLAKALGVKPSGRAFEPITLDVAGRVLEARAFGVRLSGRDFWTRVTRTFGFAKLKSLKLTAQEAGGTVRFSGFGLGHGVGLCQQGAMALARHGTGYLKILAHYFPGAEVTSTEAASAEPGSP